MFEFDFMQHAFIGCFFVSILSAIIGWLLLLRRQAFAAHALPHIGFSGAAISLLIGISPIWGMVFFSIFAAIMMFLGENKTYRLSHSDGRDTITGLVLAASLGGGSLCLHEAASSSQQMNILLFGNVLGLDNHKLYLLGGMSLFCLIILAILWRPLLFITLDPLRARIDNVPIKSVSFGFMTVVAVASSACSEVAGTLLSFSLMIGPAASAMIFPLTSLQAVLFSIISALALSWGGLALSWYSDAPVSFWISAGAILLYCLSRFYVYVRKI